MRLLATLVAGLAVLCILTVAIPFMVVGVIAVFGDALVEHRATWATVPASVVIGLAITWSACRQVGDRRRATAKLRETEFTCPVCGDALPRWGGEFETNPNSPIHTVWITAPNGSFKLHCGQCAREFWYDAWADGTATSMAWIDAYR